MPDTTTTAAGPRKRTRPGAILIDFGPSRAALDRLLERVQARNPARVVSRAEIVRRLVLAEDAHPRILD